MLKEATRLITLILTLWVSFTCSATNEVELFKLRSDLVTAQLNFGLSLCDDFGSNYQTAQKNLAEQVAKLTAADSKYILESAVMADSLKDVKQLVEQGASFQTHEYSWGASLMHIAAINASPDVIKYLHSTGIDVNIAVKSTGITPLHLAVNSNRVDNIKELLALGADINALAQDGITPITYTIACKDKNTFEYLVHQGAVIDTRVIKIAKLIGVDLKK